MIMSILLLELLPFAIVIGTQFHLPRFNLLWMESNPQKSPELGHPIEISDAKYISGLSTVLVASIQEAKDRISQIEYIFCSQLFPNLQSQFQSFQKIYSEARGAAEVAYKEKEKDLLSQITKVQHENEHLLEVNQVLRLEREKLLNFQSLSYKRFNEFQEELKLKNLELSQGKEAQRNLEKLLESKASLVHGCENTIKELEEKNDMLLKKQKNFDAETEDLRLHLMKKSKEVDELTELQNELLHINQSNASVLVRKDMQLKAYEEKANMLNSKVESMEKVVDGLQSAVGDKTDEIEKRKKVQENLLKRVEFQASEIMNKEVLFNKRKEENIVLVAEIDNLTKRVDELQKVLSKRNNELEEGRKLRPQFLEQADSFNSGRITRGQELDEYEKEKNLLLGKQRGLEEKVEKLQQSLFEGSKESSEGFELQGKLLKHIEATNSELQSEKRKKMEIFDRYKILKSQYLYLCTKICHVPETMLPSNNNEDESETLTIKYPESQEAFREIENKTSTGAGITTEVTNTKCDQEILDGNKGVSLIPTSSPVSPSTSSIPIAPKCPSSTKSCPPAGVKRPISYWRDTRSHQSHVGPDPHDDFLDTPQENIRTNSKKVIKEGSHDHSKPDPKNTTCDTSDDETQDMNVDPGPGKVQMPPPKAGSSSFKYVGPVRKKAEREKLKGVECKQCKKFYDAVLPEDGKNPDGKSIRCEHHDGVSRHRYRYEPPSTPEGFWNIGFESEM